MIPAARTPLWARPAKVTLHLCWAPRMADNELSLASSSLVAGSHRAMHPVLGKLNVSRVADIRNVYAIIHSGTERATSESVPSKTLDVPSPSNTATRVRTTPTGAKEKAFGHLLLLAGDVAGPRRPLPREAVSA